MQEPIGVSGVQAVPKTLHSQGFFTPFKISPHWQAFGSATRRPGTANFNSASNSLYFALSFNPLWAIEPSPRHSKYSRGSKTSQIAASALALPVRATKRAY